MKIDDLSDLEKSDPLRLLDDMESFSKEDAKSHRVPKTSHQVVWFRCHIHDGFSSKDTMRLMHRVEVPLGTVAITQHNLMFPDHYPESFGSAEFNLKLLKLSELI